MSDQFGIIGREQRLHWVTGVTMAMPMAMIQPPKLVWDTKAEEFYELHKDLCLDKCPFFDWRTASKDIALANMRSWKGDPQIDPRFVDHVVDLLIDSIPIDVSALFKTDLSLPNSQCNPSQQGGGISPTHQST